MIFSSLSGYDIRETEKIWERMKEANKGKEPPQFMSTHPSSNNRIKNIDVVTKLYYLDRLKPMSNGKSIQNDYIC